MMRLMTCAALTCAALLCLGACKIPPQPVYDKPADIQTAVPLRLGQHANGHVTGEGSPRQRYLVKVSQPGILKVSASWNEQDGLDRILVQRGNTAPVQTLDCRQRIKSELKFQADPGYYYLEIVPGREEASYDLVVVLETP